MNVDIIGAGGYIGKSLVDYLATQEDPDEMEYEVTEYDYTIDGDSVQNAFSGGSWPDVVVYLAAFPGAVACTDDPEKAIRDNIASPLQIMHELRDSQAKFIFISSLGAKTPNANFYSMNKWMVEREILRMVENNTLDAVILRLANVYGGKDYLEMKSSVVAKFALSKLEKKPLIINGDGSQIRDFIHLHDVVRAIRLTIDAINENDLVVNDPIEIGSGKGTSIISLARKFNHHIDFDTNNDMVGADKSIAEVEFAKKALKFEAKYDLNTYLKGL